MAFAASASLAVARCHSNALKCVRFKAAEATILETKNVKPSKHLDAVVASDRRVASRKKDGKRELANQIGHD